MHLRSKKKTRNKKEERGERELDTTKELPWMECLPEMTFWWTPCAKSLLRHEWNCVEDESLRKPVKEFSKVLFLRDFKIKIKITYYFTGIRFAKNRVLYQSLANLFCKGTEST